MRVHKYKFKKLPFRSCELLLSFSVMTTCNLVKIFILGWSYQHSIFIMWCKLEGKTGVSRLGQIISLVCRIQGYWEKVLEFMLEDWELPCMRMKQIPHLLGFIVNTISRQHWGGPSWGQLSIKYIKGSEEVIQVDKNRWSRIGDLISMPCPPLRGLGLGTSCGWNQNPFSLSNHPIKLGGL